MNRSLFSTQRSEAYSRRNDEKNGSVSGVRLIFSLMLSQLSYHSFLRRKIRSVFTNSCQLLKRPDIHKQLVLFKQRAETLFYWKMLKSIHLQLFPRESFMKSVKMDFPPKLVC